MTNPIGPQRATPASPARIAAEVAETRKQLASDALHVGDQIEPVPVVCGQRVATNPAALRSTVTIDTLELCNQLVNSGRWRKVNA